MAFLDETGLEQVWGKVKGLIATKQDIKKIETYTFNNKWCLGFDVPGMGFVVPMSMPDVPNKVASGNFTAFQVFVNGAWYKYNGNVEYKFFGTTIFIIAAKLQDWLTGYPQILANDAQIRRGALLVSLFGTLTVGSK